MSVLDLHLLRPLWLLALLPLAWLLWRQWRAPGQGAAWRRVVDPHLLPHLLSADQGRLDRAPLFLLAGGWLLLVLALAGPTWQQLPQPVYQAQQFRVIALDLSPTMNATDLQPSRLAHARYAVLDLLQLADDGQTALIAYASEPYIVSPLSSDTATIAAQVPELDTTLLPVLGLRRTDLALQQAGDLLRQAGATDGQIILVTDSLADAGVAAPAAREVAERLQGEGYRVSVLGVGTPKGAPVRLPDGSLMKDAGGAIVLPPLDSAALETLAQAGGGRYLRAGFGDREASTLLSLTPSRLSGDAQRQDASSAQWREEGPWLLILLLPLAALAFRRGWIHPLLLAGVGLLPLPEAHAAVWADLWQRADQQAMQLFESDRAEQAAERFERPDWRAAAEYRSGDYAGALSALERLPPANSAYNRGNALARLDRLEDAIAAYDAALAADPEDADARHNRAVVRRLLEQQQPSSQSGESTGQQRQDDSSAEAQQQQDDTSADGQQQQQQQDAQGQGGDAQQQAQSQSQQDAAADDRGDPSDDPSDDPSGDQQAGTDSAAKQGDDAAQTPDAPDGNPPAQAQGGERQETDERAGDSSPPGAADQDLQGDQQGQPSAGTPEPGLDDILGENRGQAQDGNRDPQIPDGPSEDAQALEQMLRQVEDDPGGLLRQRFLLQHLRRQGRLP